MSQPTPLTAVNTVAGSSIEHPLAGLRSHGQPLKLTALHTQLLTTGAQTCPHILRGPTPLDHSPSSLHKSPTLYVTCEPCPECRKLIAGAQLLQVIWPDGSWSV